MLFIEVIILIIFFSSIYGIITIGSKTFYEKYDGKNIKELLLDKKVDFSVLFLIFHSLSLSFFYFISMIYGLWTDYYIYCLVYLVVMIMSQLFWIIFRIFRGVEENKKPIPRSDIIKMRWMSIIPIFLIFVYPTYEIINKLIG